MVSDLSSAEVTTRIAASRDELRRAYELVYRSYRAKGIVSAWAQGMVYRDAFGLDTSRTLVALRPCGRVVGTLTIVGDNDHGFEMEEAYSQEIGRLRGRGTCLAELTALASEPARRSSDALSEPSFHASRAAARRSGAMFSAVRYASS